MTYRNNPPILSRYVIDGLFAPEHFIALYPVPDYKPIIENYRTIEKRVVAVYTPTGRAFLEDGVTVWEYEYQGVRII